jgi:hypothetical protein
MSCFLLSKGTCQRLTSLAAQFWWTESIDKRSLHWLSWKKLAKPTSWGGMGFRDLELFNLALLHKKGWRLLTNPNSLCARVLSGRYYPDGDFTNVVAPKTASKTWRAILDRRRALQAGLIKRIGSGDSVSMWNDRWIPVSISMRPMGRLQNSALLHPTCQ